MHALRISPKEMSSADVARLGLDLADLATCMPMSWISTFPLQCIPQIWAQKVAGRTGAH